MTEKHNPVVYYLKVLAYMILALALRAVAFAPLYCLTLEGACRFAWVLCPVLLIFVVLPLRFSFAQAMVEGKENRTFCFAQAFSFSDYAEKLSQGFLHILHVLKWGLPMAVLAVVAYVWYTQVDAITVIRSITELGAWASGVWCSVANWFGAEMTPVVNGLVEGVYVVAAVIALAVLVWMIGVVRNSAFRYLWAIAEKKDSVPSVERRRRLSGRRVTQLLVGLVNLLLVVPFLVVLFGQFKGIVNDLSNQLMMVMIGGMPTVDLTGAVRPVALAFACLYLPLLPIRRMLTVAFACGEKKVKTIEAAK